ncbi:hypothetical protein L593_02210 [Salinarchaeum sp. Harcht-Bsk1]|uniref:DUF7322 domain-containing protein n=1 Tax=Salinarchaeum sp. Harcht-Bsk1 TaxID=1333523 RepID=UPI00034234F2|nr:hypothetical protein [Salinarchaeum sp. Harcht-Bsk1]AGN00393.1 hypothetical protein L593_02210 [Salinarchaeum sp. Harcht-Bsk1]
MFGEEPEAEREAVPDEPFRDDEEPEDPGAIEAEPEFDVRTGEDLVDDLPSGAEVPADVRKVFWSSVLLLKVALVSLTLAALLAYFRGQLLLAAGLAVLGLLAGTRTVLKVRSYTE